MSIAEEEYTHPQRSTLKLGAAGYDPKRALGSYKRAKRKDASGDRRSELPVNWINYFVHPLALVLAEQAGYDGVEVSRNAAGLCGRVSVYFIKDMRRVFYLELSSPGIDKGTMCVTDYSKTEGNYPEGSIGRLNGMHHPSIVVDPDEHCAQVILQHGCPVGDDEDDRTDPLGDRGKVHWVKRPKS